MFVDNKKFDVVQRGGYTEALVFYDVKSSTKDVVPLFAKLPTQTAAQRARVP